MGHRGTRRSHSRLSATAIYRSNVTRPTLLLFGANGQLGSELARTLTLVGEVTPLTRDGCDIVDVDAIGRVIANVKPQLVINATAYTAVDKAESEPEAARLANEIAPGVMARAANKIGAGLVHYSTDYVFDGRSEDPYREDDPVAPQSVYGRTKLAGEVAIRESGCAHLIFRTSWVYGQQGSNFVKTILRLASTRDELKIVADQKGAPTWSRVIADTTTLVLDSLNIEQRTNWLSEVSGTYHLTADGATNWFEFAREIIALGQRHRLLSNKVATIRATTTAAYGAPAPRPANSYLDNEKLARTFGIRIPNWRVSAAQFIAGLGS
ncbi:MAG: dTDP-4-dehydrorhamnose reductase [Gammaproteobacteria bacterium]|nr:dTDP-4-dehydrorhamnose reductase [Gammaproteobacteria bacterium]